MRACIPPLLLLAACGDKDTDTGAAGAPTYWQDVAPIYAARCTSCHQDGSLAPMPLDDYDAAKAWAAASAAAALDRTMPPWGAEGATALGGGEAISPDMPDPGSCGSDYVDAMWLTDDEIAVISAWAEAGAPEGSPESVTAAPLPSIETHATLSTPSFLPDASEGSGGEYDEYRCFLIDPELSEDRWLTGYEVEPGNDAIVHHVIGMPIDPDRMTDGGVTNAARIAALDGADGREGWPCYSQAGDGVEVEGEYVAWAPGQGAVRFPEGSGLKLGAGDLWAVQVHYNMIETDNETDATDLRLQLAGSVERPAQMVLLDLWERQTLSAGDPAALVQWQMRQPSMANYLGSDRVVIEGVLPHMHELGEQLTMEIVSEDEATCVTGVRRWDFGWQRQYFYESPVEIMSDERLRVSCAFDLSGVDHDVSWGWGTQDEMCLVGLYVTEGG